MLEDLLTFIGYMLPACLAVGAIGVVMAMTMRNWRKAANWTVEYIALARETNMRLIELIDLQRETNRLLAQQIEAPHNPPS